MIKRFIKSLFLMIVILLMIVGCETKTYSEEKIAEIVKDSMQEKYDKEFDVLSLEEKDGGMKFANPYYVAQCTDTEGTGPFEVGIKPDGSIIGDNYEGYLYKKNIDNELFELLTQADEITFSNYRTRFAWDQRRFGSCQKYCESGNVRLIADLSVDALELTEATGVVYELLDVLQQKGYGVRVGVYWNGISFNVVRDQEDPVITRKYIDERFDAELNCTKAGPA